LQNKAEVNLKEDAVYRVRAGELEKLDRPADGYGEVIVRWRDGKIGPYEVKYTKK
jgi:hypothetical protein